MAQSNCLAALLSCDLGSPKNSSSILRLSLLRSYWPDGSIRNPKDCNRLHVSTSWLLCWAANRELRGWSRSTCEGYCKQVSFFFNLNWTWLTWLDLGCESSYASSAVKTSKGFCDCFMRCSSQRIFTNACFSLSSFTFSLFFLSSCASCGEEGRRVWRCYFIGWTSSWCTIGSFSVKTIGLLKLCLVVVDLKTEL
jgi:hypothetical protein